MTKCIMCCTQPYQGELAIGIRVVHFKYAVLSTKIGAATALWFVVWFVCVFLLQMDTVACNLCQFSSDALACHFTYCFSCLYM